MKSSRGTKMPTRDGERLARAILRFTNSQLSRQNRAGKSWWERRRSNLAVSNMAHTVESPPFVYTPPERDGAGSPGGAAHDPFLKPQQANDIPSGDGPVSARDLPKVKHYTRRMQRPMRAQLQPPPPPVRERPPPPRSWSAVDRSEPRRASPPRHVSPLEAASRGRAASTGAKPQVEAHPSGARETPFSALGTEEAAFPAPERRGWGESGALGGTAAELRVVLGTGEGPGCMPADEKGRQLHLLMRRLVMRSAQPYLGPNRVDAAGDAYNEALDLAFHQLPNNWSRKDLDWSASATPAEEIPAWSQRPRGCSFDQDAKTAIQAVVDGRAGTASVAVQAVVDGDVLDVLPMWICVHQENAEGPARLYESLFPMDDEVFRHVEALSEGIGEAEGGGSAWKSFASDVCGLNFTRQSDAPSGSWHNFFVGVVGDVSPYDDGEGCQDALWPNRVLHRSREMFNVRHGMDLAAFLAEPVKEDMEAHLGNLRRLQVEKQRSPQWTFHMMKKRWGIPALKEHGFA